MHFSVIGEDVMSVLKLLPKDAVIKRKLSAEVFMKVSRVIPLTEKVAQLG